MLAEALGLKTTELYALLLAARFHDIGLLAVPDAILLKEGPLTDFERTTVDCHSDLGGRLLNYLFPDFPDAIEAIWYHHERADGEGPHALAQELIPTGAAILSVVEALESMANGRPHQPALPADQIALEIRRGSGTQFCRSIVDAAMPLFSRLLHAVSPASANHPVTSNVEDHTRAASCPSTPTERPQPPQVAPKPGNNSPREGSVQSIKQFRMRREQETDALSALAPLLPRQDLRALLSRGLELQPISPIGNHVAALCNRPQCSIDDVAREIAKDPVLSLRVLRVANCAMYSRGKPVDHISTAVARIGVQQVRNLIMSLGMIESYSETSSKLLDQSQFWDHALACGLLAVAFGAELRLDANENWLLWGIIHDVGRLLLVTQMPETYSKVLEIAKAIGAPLEIVESKLLPFNHCAVLGFAFDYWKFPTALSVPVINHHLPAFKLRRLAPEHSKEAMVISLSNRLAHAHVFGSSGNDVLYGIHDLTAELGVPLDSLGRILSETEDHLAELRLVMMSRGLVDEKKGQRALLQNQLTGTVSPLHACLDPGTNVFQMFLNRILAAGANPVPNLGVLYLREWSEFASVSARFTALETEHGLSGLPVLVATEKGKSDSDHAWLKCRRHIALTLPVRYAIIVDAINTLLAS